MSAATRRRIAAVFEADHDGIDAILGALDLGDAASALPGLSEFDRRLERHIVWEEQVLMPAIETAAPDTVRDVLAVLRREHARIRALKQRAMRLLRRGDAAGASRSVAKVVAILAGHNAREERVLYPACDRNLPAEEVDRILDLLTCSSP